MHLAMRNCEIDHGSTENHRMAAEFPCVNRPWKEEREIRCSPARSPTHDLLLSTHTRIHISSETQSTDSENGLKVRPAVNS